MKALERELGVRLLDRLARGVRCPAAGESFADSARRILHDLGRARLHVQAMEDVVIGTLTVISLPGLLLDPIAGFIGSLRATYPGVALRVQHAEFIADASLTAMRSWASQTLPEATSTASSATSSRSRSWSRWCPVVTSWQVARS